MLGRVYTQVSADLRSRSRAARQPLPFRREPNGAESVRQGSASTSASEHTVRPSHATLTAEERPWPPRSSHVGFSLLTTWQGVQRRATSASSPFNGWDWARPRTL